MAGYPWPVQPFERQHPVRAFFRDPRIGDAGGSSFHTGVDVSAPDGTAVYAVAPGRVSIEGAQNVAVAAGDRDFGYWHVIPAVADGQQLPPHVVGNSDVHFGDIYAPGTRQNHPNAPGLFRFWLARRFDTRPHPDGDYRLDVEAADVHGNASRDHLVVTFINAARNV